MILNCTRFDKTLIVDLKQSTQTKPYYGYYVKKKRVKIFGETSERNVGETTRRLEGRVIDHNKRDKNSHILKHGKERNHQPTGINDVKILAKNFRNCLLYTSPSPRDATLSRMPSSA